MTSADRVAAAADPLERTLTRKLSLIHHAVILDVVGFSVDVDRGAELVRRDLLASHEERGVRLEARELVCFFGGCTMEWGALPRGTAPDAEMYRATTAASTDYEHRTD